MKTTTTYISDFVYESTNENANTISIDMREPGEKQGQSPMELLLSAIAGCAMVDIVQILKKKRKTVTDLTVVTEGERQEFAPKKFLKVHSRYTLISPDTSVEELEKAASLTLEKYCSVASTLNVKVDFSVEVKPTP